MAVSALALIGDHQAVPYLAQMATGTDGAAITAQQALDRLGATGVDPVSSMLALAKRYATRDVHVIKAFRRTFVAWAWVDGKLVAREVPKAVYHLKLAEETLYDALALDAGNTMGHVALARVMLAQVVAASGLDEGASGTALAHASEVASTLGAEVLAAAVDAANAEGQPAVAAAGTRLLAALEGQSAAMAGSALSEGMDAFLIVDDQDPIQWSSPRRLGRRGRRAFDPSAFRASYPSAMNFHPNDPVLPDSRLLLGLNSGTSELDLEEAITSLNSVVSAPAPVTSKYPVTLYGYLKFDMAMDTGRVNNGNFARWVDATEGDDGQFNATARQTRIGLKWAGPSGNGMSSRAQFVESTGACGAHQPGLSAEFGINANVDEQIASGVPGVGGAQILWFVC